MPVKCERTLPQTFAPLPIYRGINLEGVPYEAVEREGKLTGKTALITGASRGIGLAVAKGFANEGVSKLFIVSRKKMDQDEIDRISGCGSEIVHCMADASSQDDLDGIIQAVQRHLGTQKLDILVNNVGTTNDGPIQRHSRALLEATYALNVFAGHMLIKGLLENNLFKKPGGAVIYNASIASEGNYLQSLYAGTKAAVIGEAKSLALELGKEGMRVNVVSPGLTDTDLTHLLVEKAEEMLDDLSPVAKGEKGVLNPEDLVPAFVFLASDEAFAVNGVNLQVDKNLRGAYSAMLPLRKYMNPTAPERMALAKMRAERAQKPQS